MQRIYLKNKSYSVENLPSEPSLLVELLNLCHNDNANFEMFATAIKKDISLTAKILQVANSPAYRQWNKITDIRRMLIVLGITNVRNIVTTCAIQQFFAKFTREFSKNVQLTWLRSLVCGNLARRLAELTGYDKPGEAFLAGLLHQVGILLLLLNRPKEYLPLISRYYQETENYCFLEQEALGVDHCELGAALIDSWQLDSFISDAINFQQAPVAELMNSPTLLKILAVAAPLSSKNTARDNRTYLERAGLLFNLTEETILDCHRLAVEKSKQMITDLGFSGRFYMEQNEAELFDDEQHEQHAKSLSEQVKNLALSGSVARSECSEINALTRELRASFSTLFNLNQLFFFKSNDRGTRLTAVNDLGINQLDEIEFRTDDSFSLMSKTFTLREAHNSSSSPGSIADRQVMRILGTEAAYFLPLDHLGTSFGVLIIGTSQQELPLLEKQAPLFQLLNREIARKYLSYQPGNEETEGMRMVDFRKIAHEVSNPLTIINNYLYTLGKKIDSDHPAQEEIKFISEEIERAGNILLRAKDPAAVIKAEEKRLDINHLIRELDTLFSGSLYKTNRIESSLHLDQQIPALSCAQDKLKQVLINLIKNAVEAAEESGHISITTRDNYFQNGQQFIEIAIRDDGPGIAPEILKDLFKPVESTKKGHSGLGLSIVNTLVKEMSGSISCYSRQGEGTEFKILIPRRLENTEIDTD
ncbi:MAG: HDOD domain-containing protein [Desulfuromonadales bacterium]|nr:HDOD domain-containing protein [Desulfuromonadales bacterium]MBN2792005.1 HDOD domain-containing protein [Desulfuromonadales bacterium]